MLGTIDPLQMYSCEWRQPETFKRSFELWSGDTLLGGLNFPKMFGSFANASTAHGTWTFKRVGFFSPKTTARLDGTTQDLAVYEPNFSGTKGTLTLQGGQRIRLRSSNFWATEWTLEDAHHQPLVRFHNKGVFKHGANVEVEPAGRACPDLALLLLFAWYILVLYMEDASAASASAAASMG